MKGKSYIFAILVLLFVSLTTAAQDMNVRQGCRRGTPRQQNTNLLRRGAQGGQPKRTGGNFYHGERHQLTVLVSFTDLKFQNDEAQTLTKWNNILNATDYSEGNYVGSVHDYFYAQSYEQFNLVFDVHYIELENSIKKYRSWDTQYYDSETGEDSADDDENSQYLVNDIMDVLQTQDIDWSLYDWDGDGFVNQLLIIYAGMGMNDGGGKNSIWAHQWWLSEHLKDRQKDVYCEPRTVTNGDGRQFTVDCYCATPELGKKKNSFGTLCHEFSHCFGLPDFYYGSASYVSSWDLMDNGNYNGGGYCPAAYSAHERWLMGWLEPEELSAAATITDMPVLNNKPAAYLIRNDNYANEYYIVENRQQHGWDTSTEGRGLLIFHIDYDDALWCGTEGYVNSPQYQHYTLFHANNLSSTSGWPYPYNDNNELTNTSSPKASLLHENAGGTKLMSKPITNISINSDGLAAFDFMGGSTDIQTVEHKKLTNDFNYYNLTGQRIMKPQRGIYIVNGRKVALK